MTTQELRLYFIQEHRRDRKLTIINYVIIALGILLILGLIGALFKFTGASVSKAISDAFGGQEHDPWYVKYIFVGVLAGCILYPFYQLWKINKRPQQINELLAKIEAGGKANSIDEYKEYKVTIPLIKVNYKMCPVTYVMINLSNDLKFYKLPIKSLHIPDLKIVLSGGNLAKLKDIKKELYADEEETDITPSNEVATPIKSVDEFRTFLNENLKDKIDNIDSQRKKTRKSIMIVVPLVLIAIFGLVGYIYYTSYRSVAEGDYSGQGSISIIIPVFVVMVIISLIYGFYMKSKHSKLAGTEAGENNNYLGGASFNEQIFGKIIKFVNPTVEYVPIGHIGLPEFLESSMFEEKNYEIKGNDQISGRHNGVPFIMCELWVGYKRNFTDEKEGADSVFSGQFFVARFNKRFSSTVFIKPKSTLKVIWGNNDIRGYTHTIGEKVMLEDPEFTDMFDVYAEDQIEARYILTPSMMERIKELAKKSGGQFYIAFNNNKITVANNSQSSKFGVSYFGSLGKNDNKLFVDFYNNICNQFAIIDDLKLNVKIWK